MALLSDGFEAVVPPGFSRRAAHVGGGLRRLLWPSDKERFPWPAAVAIMLAASLGLWFLVAWCVRALFMI